MDTLLSTLQAQLGEYVLAFQGVEEAVTELIIQIGGGDHEFVGALTAELPFTNKARALDVIYTRFAQIHRISMDAPNPKFHSLVKRIQKLAEHRNDVVHSFYNLVAPLGGGIELEQRPTRLEPSKGAWEREARRLSSNSLQQELLKLQQIRAELEEFRLEVIDAQYPSRG